MGNEFSYLQKKLHEDINQRSFCSQKTSFYDLTHHVIGKSMRFDKNWNVEYGKSVSK